MWSHLTLIILALHLSLPQKLKLAPIYWNTSNPLFKSSTSTDPIEVQMYYEIDLVCPTYPPKHPPHLQETYIIYQVPKTDYENCELEKDISMLVNCSAPHERRRFTLIFQAFQAIANTPDYREGETYYVTTTSTGRMVDLNNKRGGACASKHMKVAFYIRPSGLTKVKPNKPSNHATTRKSRRKPTTTHQPHTTRLFLTPSVNNRNSDPDYPYNTVNNDENSMNYNTIYNHNHNHNKHTNKNNYNNNNKNNNNDSLYKNNNNNKDVSASGFPTSSHTISYPHRQQPNNNNSNKYTKNNKNKYSKNNPNTNFKNGNNKTFKSNNNNFSKNNNNNNQNRKNKSTNNYKNTGLTVSASIFSYIFYTQSLILATILLSPSFIYL